MKGKKKLLIILFLLGIFLVSCNKNEKNKTVVQEEKYEQEWKAMSSLLTAFASYDGYDEFEKAINVHVSLRKKIQWAYDHDLYYHYLDVSNDTYFRFTTEKEAVKDIFPEYKTGEKIAACFLNVVPGKYEDYDNKKKIAINDPMRFLILAYGKNIFGLTYAKQEDGKYMFIEKGKRLSYNKIILETPIKSSRFKIVLPEKEDEKNKGQFLLLENGQIDIYSKKLFKGNIIKESILIKNKNRLINRILN